MKRFPWISVVTARKKFPNNLFFRKNGKNTFEKMILETERLILRPLQEEDLEVLQDLLKDPSVMKYSLKGPLEGKEQAKKYLQKILDHYESHGFGFLGVILKKENRLIGLSGLSRCMIDGENKIEIGYRFFPSFWGHGFAVEACQALITYAFNKLKLDKIISIIDPKNLRSVKVVEKLGMIHIKNTDYHGFKVNVYELKPLKIEFFQKNWKNFFQEEKKKLVEVFKTLEIEFFHIGSTNLPGCLAKPVLDILGVTSDITQMDFYSETLEKLGYEAKGEFGMKQRRYFKKRSHPPVNLHIFEESDHEVERYFRFVFYLQDHPEKVKEYSEIKKRLIQTFPGNIHHYTLGKDAFIKKIDVLAAKEANRFFFEKKNLPKKKTWTLKEIIKAIDVNFYLQMTYFAKYMDEVELVFQPDATIVRSEILEDTFNFVLSSQFTKTNSARRIQEILQLVKQPFSWWVGPLDTPNTLESDLLSKGLSFKEERVGMFLNLTSFKSSTSSNLSFQRVESLSQLKQFSELITQNFELDSQLFEKFYKKIPPILYQEGASYEMYLGYIDQKPIVTGIVIFHAHVAGIYYISTVTQERRKGYATSMMEYLLKRVKDQGYYTAVLLHAKKGKNLYQSLGFQNACIFKEFASFFK